MKKQSKISKKIEKTSIQCIDIGCGANKANPKWFGVDYRKLPGVDLVQDLEKFPWKIPSNKFDTALASHVVEHINPAKGGFISFMNEAWRILKPGGEFIIGAPYATSTGMFRDPTHCAIDGTEVKTRDGFKKMQDVKIGEDVLTFNMDTEENEYSQCTGIVNEPYEGQIVRFKNKLVDIAVTPNHDLISKWRGPTAKWEKRRADVFFESSPFGRIGLATINNWVGENPKKIEIKKSDDCDSVVSFDPGDFMELLGWIIAEGYFARPNGNESTSRFIVIGQSKEANPDKYKKITELLDRMGLKYSEYNMTIRVDSKSLFDHLSILGKSEEKYIPTEYKKLDTSLLLRLLESLRCGDGEWHHGDDEESEGYTYTTISNRLASDVNEIALQCGFRSHVYLREGKEFFSPIRDKKYKRKDQYRISICPVSENFVYPKPVAEHYEGNIVCVKVAKNNTILTRLNGHVAWMGNCNFVNEETWSYFDPSDSFYKGELYKIYRPLPWKIKINTWHDTGNIEVVLIKRDILPEYNVDTEYLRLLKDYTKKIK